MTSMLNKIFKSVRPSSLFDEAKDIVSTTTTITQGDFCVFESGYIRSMTSGDTGIKFLGISRATTVNGVPKQPYTTGSSSNQGGSAVAGPEFGSVVLAVAKTGDSFSPGCAIYPYPAAGTRGVTSNGSGLTQIGVYQGPNISSSSTGQEIQVLLGTNYTGTLIF